jgi:hypothetical protein
MTSWSREVEEEPWLEGKTKLLIRSWAAKKPTALRPAFPVSFAPHMGSATVRVNTAWTGVRKKSAPSRKKGLFSG